MWTTQLHASNGKDLPTSPPCGDHVGALSVLSVYCIFTISRRIATFGPFISEKMMPQFSEGLLGSPQGKFMYSTKLIFEVRYSLQISWKSVFVCYGNREQLNIAGKKPHSSLIFNIILHYIISHKSNVIAHFEWLHLLIFYLPNCFYRATIGMTVV